MWHSLAVDESGQALAWGDNEHGQAGRGDEGAVEVPKRVKDENGDWLSGVKKVFAGYDHSMAQTGEKTLIWGRNDQNQLGDGTLKDRSIPMAAKDRDGKDLKAAVVAGGKSHTAAVMPDLSVFAWGKNAAGQLGSGKTDAPHIISLGWGHATGYAVKKDGSLWGWGWNANNFLGDNSGKDQNIPVRILGVDGVGELENVKFVDGSIGIDTRGFAFAVLENGRVCAWGANGYGQLGTGDKTDRHFPVWLMKDKENVFEENVIKVAAGEFHAAALTEEGFVYTWGHNGNGELGLGNKDNFLYPQKVDMEGVADIVACEYNLMALKQDGTVWGCGTNTEGTLGQGDITHKSEMTRVPGLEGIVSLAAGSLNCLALDAHGKLWAWGYNNVGQVGNNSTSNQLSPVRVMAPKGSADAYLENIIAVSAEMEHTLAVKEDGTVWGWGENDHGRLGYAITGNVNQQLPGQVEYSEGKGFLLGIRKVWAGTRYSFALDEDGVLWAWGRGNHGQRGDGKTHESQTWPAKTLMA
jgi:alpha-tubulin suppressor-like RCC1 family protein